MIELAGGVERYEKVFLLTAFLCSAILIYLLVIDFNIISYGITRSVGEKVLATVHEKHNTVKRRPAILPVWDELSTTDSLYEKEQIYTASSSSVTLKFDDGTSLDIGENSLIILQKAMGLLSVQLLKGEVYGSTTNKQGFQIVSKKIKTIIKNESKVQIQVKNDTPVINVISGSSSVETENSVVEVHKNQLVSVEQSGELKVKDIFIELITPEQNEKHYISNSITIEFKWKVSFLDQNNIEDLFLELSDNSDFILMKTKIVNIDKNAQSVKVNIDTDGTYFWRIKTFNKAKNTYTYSSERKIVLEKNNPSVLLRPYKNENISYQDKIRGTILFDWEQIKDVDSYIYSLSKDSSFKDIIMEKAVGFPPFSIDFLPPGSYYWKVKTVSSKRSSIWSEVNDFIISDVKLDFPITGQSVYLPTENDEVVFQWSVLKGINHYVIEISKDSNFSNLLFKNKATKNSYLWRSPTIGSLYWRIQACDKDGVVLLSSLPDNFLITRDKPKAPVIDSEYKLRIEEE